MSRMTENPTVTLTAAGRRYLREAVGLSHLVAAKGHNDAQWETLMQLRDALNLLHKTVHKPPPDAKAEPEAGARHDCAYDSCCDGSPDA